MLSNLRNGLFRVILCLLNVNYVSFILENRMCVGIFPFHNLYQVISRLRVYYLQTQRTERDVGPKLIRQMSHVRVYASLC